jgi:hypothetical protein
VHDVAGRHGFSVVQGVGYFQERADGLFAVVGFLEPPVVVGDELALLMGGLRVETVVEQV